MSSYERTSMKLLDIQNVSLSFGDKLILRDVNATITDVERPDAVQGQVICFLGPSGIGKTQLSRCIAGLQQPTKGAVRILPEAVKTVGYEIVAGADLKSDGLIATGAGQVGMVPQNYPLFDYMTVLDNLLIAGKQRGFNATDAKDKAMQYVEALGLAEHLTKYPKDLSGGTKQRVAIARQMVCASHFLVMDEPFSGLDPIMKEKAAELITQLAGMDTLNTIIVVTHDVTEGLSVADTVWMMGYEKYGPGEGLGHPGTSDFKPGATLVKQYDLADMDMCWRKDIVSEPKFLDFVGHVKAEFKHLR